MSSGSRSRQFPSHADETAPIKITRSSTPRGKVVDRPVVASAFAFPLTVALVHFVIVQVSAWVAFRFATANESSAPFKSQFGDPPSLSGLSRIFVEPLRNWDGLWYRLVAQQGYDLHQANAAFWPLFPTMMRGISRVTGLPDEVSGYLIANVSFAIALVLLFSLVSIDFDDRTARRTLWAVALFPTSFFFSAVYTESLFLVLSVGGLLAARQRMWWVAGGLGLLAALTRSYGVFLVIPYAILFVRQYGFYIREIFPRGVNVVMPALGPVIFGWSLERMTYRGGTPGHWRDFIDVQNMWNRTSAVPWETMRCAVEGCTLRLTQYGQTRDWQVDGADWSWFHQLRSDPSWALISSTAWRKQVADSDTLELIATLLFVVLILIGLKVLPLYQSLYVLPGLVIPLFSPSTVHPLMSMPRFGLTMFPLFIVIAVILRRRWLAWPVAILSTGLLILLTMQFANWFWVS